MLDSFDCSNCPNLTSIPTHNINWIVKKGCNWLNPNKSKTDKLLLVQRKCKKYIQKRRELILKTLIYYLPKEVILYVIFDY